MNFRAGSYQKPEKTLLWVLLELLWGVIHHIAFLGLVAHRAAEFTSHQCLCHIFLSVLPEEERHFLSLHQHCPNKKLVERIGKPSRLWVINVHNLLFASLLVLLSSRVQLKSERGTTRARHGQILIFSFGRCFLDADRFLRNSTGLLY